MRLVFPRAALLLLLIALAPPSRSETRTDYAYERIVTELVVPGYAALAASADEHVRDWESFCAGPDESGFAQLRRSYGRLADAWASIEFVRSGSGAEDFRAEKFYFWPERKNAVERALNALLAAAKPEELAPEAMRNASAAIQGLPALERLLFDAGASKDDFRDSAAAQFRCQAGEAIARNAAAIAGEISSSFSIGKLAITGEAKAALATDIVSAYATIKDRKIEPVLGKDRNAARPRLAEAWRSGRSLRNIEINLRSLATAANIALEGIPEEVSLPFTTEQARRIAAGLAGDLGALAAGERRSDVVLLRDAIDAAEDTALIEIPAALGVTIGFNSLDGD
jgi:hypothetical protein